MKLKHISRRAKELGLSIVELMVAILIGLIILAGVVQVVVTSKTSFLGQEEMSFIQENARYALDLIGRDLQNAGYIGCGGNSADIAYVSKVNATSKEFIGVGLIKGYEGESRSVDAYPASYKGEVRPILSPGTTTVIDYPDSLIVSGGSGRPVPIKSQSGSIFTVDSHYFSKNQNIVIVAEDCRRAAIVRLGENLTGTQFSFTNSSVCSTFVKPQLDSDYMCDHECNCSGEISNQLFLPGSVAFSFDTHAYYVANSGVLPDVPALKRKVLRGGDGVEEELALGVEDLEFLYGVLDGNNLRYKKASEVGSDEWNKVVSVQVSLLMRSQALSLNQAEARTYLGNDYNDRYMRQVVTSTFRLRNRI
jgi:type IV pilus assembly protein PilW